MAESISDVNLTTKRSFGQAVAVLPAQYLKVLTHPSVQTFAEEKDHGSWGLAWFQMLLLAVLSALLSLLASLLTPVDVSSVAAASGMSAQTLHTIVLIATAIFILVLTPISFLLANGILYLIARLFGGKGSYLQQLTVLLLFGVPMALLSSILELIPATSSWLPWLPHIYSLVLLVLAMIAVHRRPSAA